MAAAVWVAGSHRGSSSTPLCTGDSAETVCARNARAAFDHPLSAEIPTVELLVEHADGGG
ncbi:hypothetical protein ACH47B_30870 [Rhodococcus sp. NPDC019627]|uniref:hypothetical protein n=1 Tax=unclassified Rhodococcus (in: high G+C Gram-positive bacteria) TaxID=192944 RepID=UPI00340CA0EA